MLGQAWLILAESLMVLRSATEAGLLRVLGGGSLLGAGAAG